MDRTERAELMARIKVRYDQLAADENWNLVTLSEESGVPYRTVQDAMRGGVIPHERNVHQLLKALGLSATPDEVRSGWSDDTKTFLDTIGLYLEARQGEERWEAMRRIAAAAFGSAD